MLGGGGGEMDVGGVVEREYFGPSGQARGHYNRKGKGWKFGRLERWRAVVRRSL